MKIKELQKSLKKQGLNNAVFFNLKTTSIDTNFFYLTQFKGLGAIIVPSQGRPTLIVPEGESVRAKKESSIKNIKILKTTIAAHLKETLPKRKTIGLDYNGLSHKGFLKLTKKTKLKTRDVSKNLEELRLTKTSKEIKLIRKACQITDKILADAFSKIKQFKTEKELASHLTTKANELADGAAFDTIVAIGKNAYEIHHMPNSTPLKKGFCIIDFGVKYKGYNSDVSRTIYFGKPSKKEIENYKTVVNTLDKITKSVKEKTKLQDITKLANKLLEGHKQLHLPGHGLGLEVHERPNIYSKSKEELQKNMVLALEPAIYNKKWGGVRVEDNIIVEKSGCKVLTKQTKKLLTF
ncbi:aminopeptidase P family protein [Candidatus Woesearchaeota archaeon]|nr:aminopeptidase P family protein [Candidatus Woesearchaeota archaeon]